MTHPPGILAVENLRPIPRNFISMPKATYKPIKKKFCLYIKKKHI